MENLPEWNLSKIYPSIDGEEFFSDISKFERKSSNFLKKIKLGKQDEKFNDFFSMLISEYEDLKDLIETLDSYSYCSMTVNTTNKKVIAGLNKVEALMVQNSAINVAFSSFIERNKDDVRKYTQDEKNKDYAYVLEEQITKADHLMNPDMENLAADLSRCGGDSFSRLQQAVSSAASGDLNGEKKTVIELRALATNSDRSIRKAAYEEELKIWKEHEIAFSYALNGVKGSCLSLEKKRGWDNPLKKSVNDSRINMNILTVLIETLEESIPKFRSYMKAKAKYLGLKKMAFFDLFAPVGKSEKEWTYSETKKFITKQFGQFNPEMGEFAKNAFENRWIDPAPHAGKIGGAYDIYFPSVGESRVFANFDYTYDGVSTLAHELGHAWHDHVVKNKPALLRSYPMTLAETASIFSEFIALNGALEELDKKEQLPLVEQFVQNACQICIDILCRFYFEREIFNIRKDRELMPEELCSIMIDCQKKTYGDGLDENYLHPYMWAVKSHYYSQHFSFYNYPYAFGQLFGLGLYSRSLKDTGKIPFYKKYNQLLSLTGQISAKDVAATAGIDLESKEFWHEGMNIIESFIDRFMEYMN